MTTTTDRGRFSAKRKREAGLQLLRGETLDVVSRELGVTAAMLAGWRVRFLAGGEASLKSRDGAGRDLELARRRRKVGELTMDNEVLPEAVRRHQATGPYGREPGEAMSQATSPTTGRRSGLARVARRLGVARSSLSLGRRIRRLGDEASKRGLRTPWTDAELPTRIEAVLETSPFVGEGHRKVWARLRHQGVRTSKPRVLRLMRAAPLWAPSRARRILGPHGHDGTIIPRPARRAVGHRRDERLDGRGGARDGLHRRGPLHGRGGSASTPPAAPPGSRRSSRSGRGRGRALGRWRPAWRRGWPSDTIMAAST